MEAFDAVLTRGGQVLLVTVSGRLSLEHPERNGAAGHGSFTVPPDVHIEVGAVLRLEVKDGRSLVVRATSVTGTPEGGNVVDFECLGPAG